MPAGGGQSGQKPRTGYAVVYPSGKREVYGDESPAFTIAVADERQLCRVLTGNAYSAALDFIHKRFEVSGSLIAALRFRKTHSQPSWMDRLWPLAARFAPARIETWLQGKKRAADNIRFHYDVSNEFYQTFLDSRMIYSAALFEKPEWSLDQAQEAKLRTICEMLDLHPGDRFLDIGCGWGGLLTYCAMNYRVQATGCTLSHNQFGYTRSLIQALGLERYESVLELDYRDIPGRFDKIASIGMFEHVGRHRLAAYFRTVYNRLESGGRFLNSGIVRPQGIADDPQTWFVLNRVFPGGELAHLSDVIRAAEGAGFETLRIDNLRQHYGRTCREWVSRLSRSQDRCIGIVGEETYRTWLLYLAAAAMNFEAGSTSVVSILMRRP